MQGLQQQLSDSPATLTPHCFDKHFTTERGHCPGTRGSTGKECANETTAQPNGCNVKMHGASFTQGRCRQSRQQKWHLHQSMTPLQDAIGQAPVFVISSSLLPTRSALAWARASPASPQPYLTSPNSPALPIPTILSSLTRYNPPAALPLTMLSFDYKLFLGKDDLLLCVGTVPRKMEFCSQGTTVT